MLATSNSSSEERLAALQELQPLVEPIDNANGAYSCARGRGLVSASCLAPDRSAILAMPMTRPLLFQHKHLPLLSAPPHYHWLPFP